jgi:hypothetical protein
LGFLKPVFYNALGFGTIIAIAKKCETKPFNV